MTFLLVQTEIISKIANILYNSFDHEYDKLIGEYEYIETVKTIGMSVAYELEGNREYIELPAGVASKSIDLCEDLRKLMCDSTGGEWKSFHLTLDAHGKAHSKFHY